MRTNGTIKIKTTTGGGLDQNGDPIPVTQEWSEPIDCLIVQNTNGRIMKYMDGEQVKANYEIHLEENPGFDFSTIQITHNQSGELGEHQVLRPNIQRLEVTGRTTITV